ncbi:hypothetical protein HYPSUDRAFT_78730 [Hypholoma sublateritium FD-334 SS-4]|uniref:D-xylose 1-dehydrogenase (NADP(+), D-xylono-1,5-lactone-forming) n=1 Tax=Hypholoma sublateritium (strain FD-334 SS-4) TaxID=945553 RepID=A0A0D2KYM7_HYPSF|nr:hypothetical protein HYPSUDRAFT_78730 [Hypholoma sublateritium FD-334 SS-4]
MALFLQTYMSVHQYIDSWIRASCKKTDNALKLGIISSATINAAAIIHPVQSHADVRLYAIASRDASKAASLANKYGFQKSYGAYEDLLSDKEIDFVYISLPNSLHFEWSLKALAADKNVLVEKPFTSNAREAQILVDKARECGKVLMEACAWEFHPAAHRFRQLLDSQEFGSITNTYAGIASTPPIPSTDIRWKYELSGGSLMDMCNVVSLTRFALHAKTPDAVLHATATASQDDPRVDSSMVATMRFKVANANTHFTERNVISTVYTDMARRPAYGLVPRVWELPTICVETELANVYFYNAAMPDIYHYIAITNKETGDTRYERMYGGGPLWGDRGKNSWSIYRYQLEAFVDKLRGRHPVWWIDGEDSIAQMKTIDEIYVASGLPLRPTNVIAALIIPSS